MHVLQRRCPEEAINRVARKQDHSSTVEVQTAVEQVKALCGNAFADDFTNQALEALRPLSIDVGPCERAEHGYRVHTGMIRFIWKEHTVEDAIDELEGRHRRRAEAAYEYLMQADDTVYKEFIKKHNDFLGRPPERQRWQQPARFLETVGLECALWPNLYHRTDMCETYVRSIDCRRLTRQREHRREQRKQDEKKSKKGDGYSSDSNSSSFSSSSSSGDGDKPEHFGKSTRESAKASFLAKVFSEVIGYGTDYNLMQFQYDLWLWSALGGAKNASGTSIRTALSGKTFSPEYWRTMHAGLVDLQRQFGLPTLFLTVAPYEWSAPYHEFIEDELKKAMRSRTWLPAAETCHLAHLLKQVVVGLATGSNRKQKRRKDRNWTKHIFSAKDQSGKETVVNFFARLEYQDGKRKRKTGKVQDHHGGGTVHVHCLIWLDDVADVKLEEKLSAHLPEEDGPDREVVPASQQSYSGSGWPRHDGPSEYDDNAGVLRLHHDAEDKRRGIRAFIRDITEGMFCHVDVQTSDGRGMLLRYVAGYVPKFSDSFANTWLNDEASDYAIARRILADYHPLEPEMWLQFAAQLFSQCFAGGSTKRFVVPVPWRQAMPQIVDTYTASDWRGEDMSLLEFLRKANKDGKILKHIRAAHEDSDLSKDLEAFAREYKTRGEVMIASIVLSRFNDAYYGQWLVLNVPFRDISDLWLPEVELVPKEYQHFALCLLHKPEHWRSQDAVRRELEIDAFKDNHIDNVLSMQLAYTSFIDKYLAGELHVDEDAVPQWNPYADDGFDLDAEQVWAVQAIEARAQRAEALRWNGEEDYQPPDVEIDLDEQQRRSQARVAAPMSPYVLLGPAGSGKTTVLDLCVKRRVKRGGRVLIALPTGMLASRYREKFPDLDVDTVHGAFLIFQPEQQTLEMMNEHDLIIIDEVGQLSRWIFERLMRLWHHASRRPAFVLAGDFC